MVHAVRQKPATETQNREIDLDTRLAIALEHARRLTDLHGTHEPNVAVAWDTVEELLKVQAKRRGKEVSEFDRYCALNPEASECRVYDL